MYAEQKKIDLKSVSIKLTHNRIDEIPRPSRNSTDNRIDRIEADIGLKGNLDSAQRRRMLEIAGRCWMHRTLSNGVTIRFRALKE